MSLSVPITAEAGPPTWGMGPPSPATSSLSWWTASSGRWRGRCSLRMRNAIRRTR